MRLNSSSTAALVSSSWLPRPHSGAKRQHALQHQSTSSSSRRTCGQRRTSFRFRLQKHRREVANLRTQLHAANQYGEHVRRNNRITVENPDGTESIFGKFFWYPETPHDQFQHFRQWEHPQHRGFFDILFTQAAVSSRQTAVQPLTTAARSAALSIAHTEHCQLAATDCCGPLQMTSFC